MTEGHGGQPARGEGRDLRPTAGYRLAWSGHSDRGMAALLPREAVAVEAVGSVEPDRLFPEEEAAIASAVEKRRLEYARARSCAHRALAALGRGGSPILTGANREPLWPPGVMGSITHCSGYCCAVCAPAACGYSIGIDAEVLRPIESGMERMILRREERAQIATMSGSVPWPCVVFSIKESIYKAWYPLTHRWLNFNDAAVRLDPSIGVFEADLMVNDPLFAALGSVAIRGRFMLERDLVLSAAVVAR